MSPATDTGVVGAALPALRHAFGLQQEAAAAVAAAANLPQWDLRPRPSVTPHLAAAQCDRVGTVNAVSLEVEEAPVMDHTAAVPNDVPVTGAALAAAASSGVVPQLSGSSRTGVAAAHRDESLKSLLAHSVLITRRQMRARKEVPAAEAGAEFDAATEAELLAWMVHGADEEVPFAGQRVLSIRWVLTITPPSLPGHSSFTVEAFSLLQGLLSALNAAAVTSLLFEGTEGTALPVHAFIDSRALHDSISSVTATGSNEVRAAVAELCEHYLLGTLASIKWLPGSYQL